MPASLDTTNTMLAIIAAVSVIQGLFLVGLAVAGWKIYRAATATLRELDDKRVKPLAAKVDGILDHVHGLTHRVHQRAERIEAAIDDTVTRVNHTTTGVKSTVSESVHRVSDVVATVRSLIVNALTTEKPGGTLRHAQGAPSGSRAGNGHRHESRFAHESAQAPRAESRGESVHYGETRDVREGGL